ncbi:ulp1 protease family, C-terminal catalytic domain-containing protein [Tanacetum coccineum]
MLRYELPCCYADGVTYGVPWFAQSVEKVYFSINVEEVHWILAELHIGSGVVTFYDSLPPNDLTIENQKWWLDMRACYASQIPKLLLKTKVLDKMNIDPANYSITYRYAVNVPRKGDAYGDCGIWVMRNMYRWFSFIADVAKYGRTYNRPVERMGTCKPQCSGHVGWPKSSPSNAGVRISGVVWIVTRYVGELGMKDDIKDRPGGSSIGIMGSRGLKESWVAYWAPILKSDGGSIPSLILGRNGVQRVLVRMIVWEKEEHLDCKENNLKDDAGEFLEFILRVDCGNVITDE